MRNEDVMAYLQQAAKDMEAAAEKLLPKSQGQTEGVLYDSMRYSLLAGGKRLRPALFFAALEAFGKDRKDFLAFAVGLEMIHTYSLIHDDLPAMDDDDLRRGRPTNHKVYGEAVAILAGDALLTDAFSLMLADTPAEAGRQLRAVREVSLLAGIGDGVIGGMVSGQAAELAREGSAVDLDGLREISLGKTSGLFGAALVSGAVLGGANEEQIAGFKEFAAHLGLAFQIIDDVLDVTGDAAVLGKPTGSDAERELSTFVTLLGVDGATQLAMEEAAAAEAALPRCTENGELLSALIRLFIQREK